MAKPARLSTAPRRLPCQERGQRRVEALLAAAAAEFQTVGYDAATMSSIADRAGASIGSLYQFFPHKEAVARALRSRLGRAYDDRLAVCLNCAARLTLPRLVSGYVDQLIAFVRDHPAILSLLSAPAGTRAPQHRRRLEQRIAQLLRAHQPGLSRAKAARLATVMLQINRSMLSLYIDASPSDRRWVIAEFKSLLLDYLSARVGAGSASRPRRSLADR